MEIIRYEPSLKREWDEFAVRARQQSLLFVRDYMDYHSHRFADHSLIAYDHRGKIAALLPANYTGNTLHSHQGLTFGGWLTPLRHFNASTMLDVWSSMASYLKNAGFEHIIYKRCPWIYCQAPADDDEYALFRHGTRLSASIVSSAFPLDRPRLLNQSTRSARLRARRAGVRVEQSGDIETFWHILARRLDERHSAVPVHTAEELSLLISRFPNNIKLYMAYCESEAVAGTLVYVTPTVAHTQYMATTEAGRATKALTAVIDYAVADLKTRAKWWDFGSSCENGGLTLNEGLELQKSGLGGRSVCHNTYTVDLT